MSFQIQTVEKVILPLIASLVKLENTGFRYKSKSVLYRQIELLKFPNTKRVESTYPIYGWKQYDTIVDYLEKIGLITIMSNPNHKGAYIVQINKMG